MKALILVLFILMICGNTNAQSTDTLTNEKIIKLHKAGFSKEILKSKIKNSPTNFNVSLDGMLNLKKEGVPEEIISMMISGPQVTAPVLTSVPKTEESNMEQGIYYVSSSNQEKIEIEPNVLTSSKSSGLGGVSGIFNNKVKSSLSGDEASLEINEKTPKFLFFFDTLAINNINANKGTFSDVKSPNEFILVKLNVQKNSREITVGKGNAYKSSSGIEDDQIRSFSLKKISKGIYEIWPKEPLSNGEYCFMFASGIREGIINKVFDFSIKLKKGF